MSDTGAWYAVIDCAQDPRLIDLVGACRDRLCLFKGRNLAPALLAVAPWLVRIDPAEPLMTTWQQHGQGRNWGIWAYSSANLAGLQRHFRRFLQAKLPDGMIVLFRFYDPRVLGTYLKAATPEEREPWFAQVQQFRLEGEQPGTMHDYRLWEGQLYDGASPIG